MAMHCLHAPILCNLQRDPGLHARRRTVSRRVLLLRCLRLSALCKLQRAAASAKQIRRSKDAALEMSNLHREAAVRALREQAEYATQKCTVSGRKVLLLGLYASWMRGLRGAQTDSTKIQRPQDAALEVSGLL